MKKPYEILADEMQILESDVPEAFISFRDVYVLEVVVNSIKTAQEQAYKEGQRDLFNIIGEFFNKIDKEKLTK